jgi:hypothetical protein
LVFAGQGAVVNGLTTADYLQSQRIVTGRGTNIKLIQWMKPLQLLRLKDASPGLPYDRPGHY